MNIISYKKFGQYTIFIALRHSKHIHTFSGNNDISPNSFRISRLFSNYEYHTTCDFAVCFSINFSICRSVLHCYTLLFSKQVLCFVLNVSFIKKSRQLSTEMFMIFFFDRRLDSQVFMLDFRYFFSKMILKH